MPITEEHKTSDLVHISLQLLCRCFTACCTQNLLKDWNISVKKMETPVFLLKNRIELIKQLTKHCKKISAVAFVLKCSWDVLDTKVHTFYIGCQGLENYWSASCQGPDNYWSAYLHQGPENYWSATHQRPETFNSVNWQIGTYWSASCQGVILQHFLLFFKCCCNVVLPVLHHYNNRFLTRLQFLYFGHTTSTYQMSPSSSSEQKLRPGSESRLFPVPQPKRLQKMISQSCTKSSSFKTITQTSYTLLHSPNRQRIVDHKLKGMRNRPGFMYVYLAHVHWRNNESIS